MVSAAATSQGAVRLAPARRGRGVPGVVTAAAGAEHPSQQSVRHVSGGHPARPALRVLRYPSGEERVIRYSDNEETLSTGPALAGAPVAPAAYWATRRSKQGTAQSSPPSQAAAQPSHPAVPDTPAALAHVASGSLTSGLSRAVATAQAALTVYTPNTSASPPQQATCYLLAHPPDAEDGQAVMVTLPTRVAGVAFDFAPGLEVAHMHDGVLAFASEHAAAAYADDMAADGNDGVSVMAVDTPQLFELAAGSDACVIWFRHNASEAPPRPAELAMVLRAHGW